MKTTKKDRKRVEILKAAAGCLEKYGYNGTGLEEVGNAVGLNKSSLLYYFKGKDEMLMQAMFMRVQPKVEELQQKALKKQKLYEALSKYMSDRVEFYSKIILDVKLDLDDFVRFEVLFRQEFNDFYNAEDIFIAHLIRQKGNLKKAYVGKEMEIADYISFMFRSIRKNYFVFKTENSKLPAPVFKEMIERINQFLQMTVSQIETA